MARTAVRRWVGLCVAVLCAASGGRALAQPAPPKGPPAGPPPGTGTDMEIDPDAKPPPPEEPKKEEPPPLPPPDKDAWGVGGKDEEGRFAPQTKKKQVDEDDSAPVVPPPPAALSLDTVIGFGKIRVVTDDTDATKATAVSFVAGFSYRVFGSWTLGARFPYTRASTTGPLGTDDSFNTFAAGNLELSVRPVFEVTRHVHVLAGVALDLPTAAGDPFADKSDRGSTAQAIVNQAAAASRGWEENALFASKRLGIVPSVGIAYDKRAVHLAAGTKLEIMVRTGGNDAPPPGTLGQATIHNPTTNWVTGASFFYDFLDGRLSPGLRAWLAVAKLPVSFPTIDYSGAQVVLEPDVTSRVPLNAKKSLFLRGGLGYILPLGGPLGGKDKATMNGLRIQVAFEF